MRATSNWNSRATTSDGVFYFSVAERDSTKRLDHFTRAQFAQRNHGGLNDVLWIATAETFGQAILHADHVQDGSHRCAGDNASSWSGWNKANLACAVATFNHVGNCAALHVELLLLATTFLLRFFNG